MSVPLTTVSAIPGVKDLWSLLAFLNDYKAVEKRLAELTAQETRLNARIAEVGKAGEVESLWAHARAERQEAAELKAQAQADAHALKAAAMETRDQAIAETARLRKDLATEQTRLAEAVTQAEKTARARETAVHVREVAVTASETRTADLLAQAGTLKADLEARLARLKAASVAAGA